jgi:phage replication-related protein YjqB (UPF0714/DUF867 family)
MADVYDSFAKLAAAETEGLHYRIFKFERPSLVTIIAPHGGLIERGTSELARSIAADMFSLYCFEALERRGPGASLHITSVRFDEPQAIKMIKASEVAVSVHGRKNREDHEKVWVGGLNERLRDAIAQTLEHAGFAAKTVGDGHRLAGRDPENICNKGRRRAGVQLELPLALRLRILSDALMRKELGDTVREAIRTEFGIADSKRID